MMNSIEKNGYAGAILFARGLLGLIFLMAGWFKVFELGAYTHAERFFVEGYRENWIPIWMLWATGFAIPYLELLAGAMLIVGFRVREALFVLGGILLLVTYGHLLKEPLYDITTHIFPRSVLLLLLLLLPRDADRWSVDGLWRWWQARRTP